MRMIWRFLVMLTVCTTAIAGLQGCGGDDDDDDETVSGDGTGLSDDDGGGADDDGGDDEGGEDDDGDDEADDDGDDDGADDDDDENAPSFSNNHDSAWDCLICHGGDFPEVPQEPHGSDYSAPDDCVTCHTAGGAPGATVGPNPPSSHDQSLNCLSCHGGKHGQDWEAKQQCFMCHNVPA